MKESMAEQLAKLTGQPVPEKQSKKKKKRNFSPIKKEHLSKGHILFVPLSDEEGLVVTGGYKEKNKFITVIGVAPDGAIIGSLLINTDPNKITAELGACQFPLKEKDYPAILDYDSWLDCSQIFRIPKQKIVTKGGYCGEITDVDWGYINSFLIETDVLSKAEKKEFGLIE
jgi:hypothetical protein